MDNNTKIYNDQIKDLTRKLAEAEAFKGHFLSNIRNAITNPFTSIVGLSEEIIRSDKEAWKKVIMMASLIHGEAINLDFQLNNIFCAAEIESGELMSEAVRTDVRAIFDRTVQKYQLFTNRKALKVNFNYKISGEDKENKYFVTDPKFMDLIFIILFDNAIKFTGPNGQIDIHVIQENNQLKLEISDTGNGIDRKGLPIIFDRFKRLDSNINSVESGHGLGLAIIKYLVELFDGNVEVTGLYPHGTKFTVLIPEMIETDNAEGYSTQGNEFLFIDNEIF